MGHLDKVNILLVDDQPSKLLSYEVILRELDENLFRASSGKEALEHLLKNEIAVVLMDVSMPDLDGFELAAMIRDHPRFQKTAIIFISAINLTDADLLRGYEMGGVDYVPVPVIPEVLRAKVKVFAELYRKTRQLEQLNARLEKKVAVRTAEIEASHARLRESEQRRNLALAAGNMGSWDWDRVNGDCLWDDGHCRIFGVDPERFKVTPENVKALVHPEDWEKLRLAAKQIFKDGSPHQAEFRVCRPNGEVRWCIGSAAASTDVSGHVVRISGVTIDITDRKEAEEHQALLAREVDHRAKNTLALVQSFVRLTRASSLPNYIALVEGRISALARAHTVLSHSRWQGAGLRGLVEEEVAPYRRPADPDTVVVEGPEVLLKPSTAQTLALVLHELATNAAKYGALSVISARVKLVWELTPDELVLRWAESGGPATQEPRSEGFGTRVIKGGVEAQLGGKVVFEWRPEGLLCVLTIPRGENIAPPERPDWGRQSADEDGSAVESRFGLSGDRVMVVEDEALIGMGVSNCLTELGYSVVGPFSRTSEAMNAIEEIGCDAAVLDINLAGTMVYPVAERLAARGVPFIFMTGYSAETLDRRFAKVPVLQKPIDRQGLERIFSAVARVGFA